MDTELQQLAKTDRNPIQETRYQELMKGSTDGANTGGYDTLLSSMPKAADFAKQINTGINTDFQSYLDYVKNAPNAADTYTKNLEAGGVPQLQKSASTLNQQMYDVEDALKNVESQVAGTTQQSLVTQAQREGMIQEKRNPLQERLGTIGTALGRITSAIAEGKSNALTLTGLSQQDSQRVLDAYSKKLELAVSQGSQSLQAFLSDTNNVLNVSLAKIHRGEALDDQERQNAFALLQMNKQAELELSNSLKLQEAKGTDDGLMTLSEGQTLFDPANMKALYTVPKTYKPESGGGGAGEDYYDRGSDWEVIR